MGRKKKLEYATPEDIEVSSVVDIENPPKLVPEKPKFREFKYGDLMFECNRCGYNECLEKGVEGGVNMILPTTDQHQWVFACARCKNTMRFYFKEAFEKGTGKGENIKEHEPVQEDNKEK